MGSRLDLVETRAIGSVTRNYRPNSESGAEIIPIEFNGEIIPLYVNGGPYFEPTDENQVVGYYNFKGKRLPAIMYKNSGLGKVVLCGAHFEFEHSHVDHNSRLWFTASILRLLDVKVYVD